MSKEILELYAWVLAGSQRVKIIKLLESPKTPKLLVDTTKLHFSNVSDVLAAMKEKKLVELLTPDNHLGRLYVLTPLGKKVLEKFNH